MNTPRFVSQPYQHAAMPPGFSAAMVADDDADDDWSEFLGLGMAADGHVDDKGWKNAPVLLSY